MHPDGSSTSPTETREDHLPGGEAKDYRPAHQDPRPEAAAEEVAVEAAEEVEEEGGERSLYPDTHHPNLQKNSWETHQQSSQETGRRSTPSSPNGSCTAVSMRTTRQSRINIKRQCCSSPTSRGTWYGCG